MHRIRSRPIHFLLFTPLSLRLHKLGAPVVHQRRRTRHHRARNQRLRPGRLRERCEDQTDRCERLSEPHFIGENAARSVVRSQAVDAVVEEEKAFFLVRLELGGERRVENYRGCGVAFRIDEAVLDHERVGSFGVETGLGVKGKKERKLRRSWDRRAARKPRICCGE